MNTLTDAVNGLVFASTISVIIFVLQYTFTSPWWDDPVGFTLVAKDVALLILLVPSSLVLIWPHLLTPLEGGVIAVASLAFITMVMVWRSIVWYRINKPSLDIIRAWLNRIRQARLRRQRADKDT